MHALTCPVCRPRVLRRRAARLADVVAHAHIVWADNLLASQRFWDALTRERADNP